MEPDIRIATIADEAAINAIWRETDAFHHQALPHLFGPPADPVRSHEVFAALLAHPEHRLLVAAIGHQIIGCIHVSLRQSEPPMAPRRFAVVEAVGVATAHRGTGTGRQLMLAAQYWAGAHGAADIWLNVWEFNRAAIGLYETLGYETVSRRMRLPVAKADADSSTS